MSGPQKPYGSADGRFGTFELLFRDKAIVDPFGRILLLGEILLGVRFEAGLNEREDIGTDNTGKPVIFFPIPGSRISFTVFLDGLSGYAQFLSNRSLGHSFNGQFSDNFIDFHFNNHIFHTSCKLEFILQDLIREW